MQIFQSCSTVRLFLKGSSQSPGNKNCPSARALGERSQSVFLVGLLTSGSVRAGFVHSAVKVFHRTNDGCLDVLAIAARLEGAGEVLEPIEFG